MNYISTADIERANERAGFHFFEPATLRFFASRVAQTGYLTADHARAYFVTSEQFRPFDGTPAARRYTVRVCDLTTGDVDTVGEFQQYACRSTADRAARTLAAGEAGEAEARHARALMREARAAAVNRGHWLGTFGHGSDWYRHVRTATCRYCAMSVTVNPRPQPNEVEIGGEAVALNCVCAVTDCTARPMYRVTMSINGAPRARVGVCRMHRDAALEDRKGA